MSGEIFREFVGTRLIDGRLREFVGGRFTGGRRYIAVRFRQVFCARFSHG